MNIKTKISLSIFNALAVLMFLASQNANASFIGDTVSCSLFGTSQTCSSSTAVVDASEIEFTFGHSGFPTNAEIDIQASSFTITALRSLTYGGTTVTLSDFDWLNEQAIISNVILEIRGVTNDETITGTPSLTAFDNDSVSVNLAGIWQAGDSILVTMETTAVPLPTAIWLFGAGLLSLVGLARGKDSGYL